MSLDGYHVVHVGGDEGGGLIVTIESAPGPMGCPRCGVVAHSRGRRVHHLAADESRFDGVHTLGVEHIWHHVSTKRRSPMAGGVRRS